MSRTWSQTSFEEGQIFKAPDYNRELSNISSQVEGGLGEHSVGLQYIDTRFLQDRAVATNLQTFQTGSSGPFNNVFVATAYAGLATTPLLAFSGSAGQFSNGWNSLSSYNYCYFPVTLEEGVLIGDVTVDAAKRAMIYTSGSTPAGEVSVGRIWFEVGVFVDGTLTASTGKIYSKRKTLNIPFSVPCAGRTSIVEIKWKASDWRGSAGDTNGPFTSPFELWGVTISLLNKRV